MAEIGARCKWCGEEFDLVAREDGLYHLEDVKALSEAHYGGVLHAEMFLRCLACFKAPEGHRPCYDVACYCECST